MSSVPLPCVAGFFTDPDRFMAAAAASTARGHVNHDGFMPYPIHGFDKKFGLRRSWIGRVVLTMLLTGAVLGFWMQVWMMKESWPIIIGGKPYNSWPAYVVITFECGILCGSLTNMAVVLLVACRLWPQTNTWVIKPRCTDDTFSLCIPLAGNGKAEDLRQFLIAQGAEDVALYEAGQTVQAAAAEVAHA